MKVIKINNKLYKALTRIKELHNLKNMTETIEFIFCNENPYDLTFEESIGIKQ